MESHIDIARYLADYGGLAILAYASWTACKTLYSQHLKSQERMIDGYTKIVDQLEGVIKDNSAAVRELRDSSMKNCIILEAVSKRIEALDASGRLDTPGTRVFIKEAPSGETPMHT